MERVTVMYILTTNPQENRRLVRFLANAFSSLGLVVDPGMWSVGDCSHQVIKGQA